MKAIISQYDRVGIVQAHKTSKNDSKIASFEAIYFYGLWYICGIEVKSYEIWKL